MRAEIRAGTVHLEGYVNAVGRDSRPIPSQRGPFVEQVVPGTFRRALQRGKPVALCKNHGPVIAGTKERTLELREDNIGLYAKAEVTDPEIVDAARSGGLRGWSFGFLCRPGGDRWEETSQGISRRYLEDIDLREVSIIDQRKCPTYPGTSVEVRGEEESLVEYRASEEEQVEVVDNTPTTEPSTETTEEHPATGPVPGQRMKYWNLTRRN